MAPSEYRYFTTYSGVRLPVRLVGPLSQAELDNRNTFIRAQFDGQDRIIALDKLVYGDVELAHRYRYYPGGGLMEAEIEMDGDVTVMRFDAQGELETA